MGSPSRPCSIGADKDGCLLAVFPAEVVDQDAQDIGQVVPGIAERIDLCLLAIAPGDRNGANLEALPSGDNEELDIEGCHPRAADRLPGVGIQPGAREDALDGVPSEEFEATLGVGK